MLHMNSTETKRIQQKLAFECEQAICSFRTKNFLKNILFLFMYYLGLKWCAVGFREPLGGMAYCENYDSRF